jgi:hypothetical protein
MTVRRNLDGTLDVTYGPGIFVKWQGMIEASASPPSGYGSIADLRSSLQERNSLNFVDHYGTSYTVHAVGPFQEESFSPKWDGTSNKIYVGVTLVAE